MAQTTSPNAGTLCLGRMDSSENRPRRDNTSQSPYQSVVVAVIEEDVKLPVSTFPQRHVHTANSTYQAEIDKLKVKEGN